MLNPTNNYYQSFQTGSPNLFRNGQAGTGTRSNIFSAFQPDSFWNPYFIPLIQRLLEQYNAGQGLDSFSNPVSHDRDYNAYQVAPQVQDQGLPYSIPLNPSEQDVLNSLFLSDNADNLPQDLRLEVFEGYYANGQLSAGDIVRISNHSGETTQEFTLTENDIYDLRFRQSMVRQAENLEEGGWRFNADMASIDGVDLEQPNNRFYLDDYGRIRTEKVIQQNDYWETVIRDDRQALIQRQYDGNGNRVSASDAIKHIFDSPEQYSFDCSTPMPLMALRATLDVIGEDDFNQRAGGINLSGWLDTYDNSKGDGGLLIKQRHASAGEISVDGAQNLDGEMAMFNPAQGDKLTPGGAYYFDKPGDATSAFQGWNALYLGRSRDGGYRFWSPDIGISNVHFKQGSWIPENHYHGHYLAALSGESNVNRLQSWDRDRSGLA